jgi:thiol-disulfide isomerase/thioredoxin
MRSARRFLVLAATLALVAVACGPTIQTEEDSRIGQKAPEFTLPDFEGRPVSLSHYQGKVIVLDFWASWCAPCVAELPVFQDLHERYNGKGFEVVGVNLSDQNPDIGGFLKEKNIHYTNLVGNDSIEKLYGPITGYPTTFIIDRNGTIREHFVGGQPPSVIENAVKQYL